ncbi:hypothetical protein B0H66DRAFT_542118 [Apodospora peruviana]|uniref:Uncharacterized protein n=1 Tax=Apodospora peruviana TaxID=516989 RepID=A0AAE0MEQ0_9PEZI|nr:hypothetical protein B0H66DRAFT_542118 [Apodospora peruviana]
MSTSLCGVAMWLDCARLPSAVPLSGRRPFSSCMPPSIPPRVTVDHTPTWSGVWTAARQDLAANMRLGWPCLGGY